MKCFDDVDLQRYIDGEISGNEKDFFEQHFSVCEKCASAVKQKKDFIVFFKDTINSRVDNYLIVPLFNYGKNSGKTKQIKLKRFVYSVAAACILLLAVFFVSNLKDSSVSSNVLTPYMNSVEDANSPVEDYELVIHVVDPNGNASEIHID